MRNMGVTEGNEPLTDNDWEAVRGRGNQAIENWIDQQMQGRSCVAVLIGTDTHERRWVIREIVKGWDKGKGVLGIYIHGLRNQDGKTSSKGLNPFDKVTHTPTGLTLAKIAPAYHPTGRTSQDVYASIQDNIADWIENAIAVRARSS